MNIGDEVILPVYLFDHNSLVASSEVTIVRLADYYTGVLELENNFLPLDIRPKKRNSKISVPLRLVYGDKSERVSVQDLKMSLQGQLFIGFVTISNEFEIEMNTARSLTNHVR